MENPANRSILQQNILRVGRNQIVQVIWKIQLGSIEQFGGYVEAYRRLLEYIESLGSGDRVSVYDAMSGTQVTAGSAVIAQRQHQDVSLMAFSWEQGTGNPSTGALDSSDSYRIRCPEYIDIPQDYSGSMTVNAAVEGASTVYWTPYFYNSGKSFYGGLQWFECGAAVEIPPAYAAYTRIILCVSPSRATTITPEQLQACTAVFY
jgi:hypothetical protein